MNCCSIMKMCFSLNQSHNQCIEAPYCFIETSITITMVTALFFLPMHCHTNSNIVFVEAKSTAESAL